MEDLQQQLAALRRRVARIDRKYAVAPPAAPRTTPAEGCAIEQLISGELVRTPHGEHFETEKLWERHRRHGSVYISDLAESARRSTRFAFGRRDKATIESSPFEARNKDGTSLLITFLSNAPEKLPLPLPVTIPKSTAQVISAGNSGREVFSLTHGGGEGALPNPFVESKLKVKATTRNVNTIGEIVKKFSALSFFVCSRNLKHFAS